MNTYLLAGVIIALTVLRVVSTDSDKVIVPEQPKILHVLFVGDIMFDRAVRKNVESRGFDFVFGDSQKLFDKADIVVANLEGSITIFPTRTVRADGTTNDLPLDFTFSTKTAPALHSVGVDVVSLANNHTANRDAAGLAQTRRYLASSSVDYFGDPGNIAPRATTTCRDNYCIALIGYHEFANKNTKQIAIDIKNFRADPKINLIIVMPHWGIEYQKTPTGFQRELAHAWIEAGADIIIGAHPHVIESVETYRGHTIFYSLGNYIFDQYFSFDTTHGLAVDIGIDPKSTSTAPTFTLLPIENKRGQTLISPASTTTYILNDLAKISKAYTSTSTREQIKTGKINFAQ